GIDMEFIHEPFGSRQAESQRFRRAEASGKGSVQVCNSRPMINKLELQPHSVCAAQYGNSSDTLLRVNPDVATKLRGRCRERRDRELIKPICLCKFSHALPHGHDVRFLVDSDLAYLRRSMLTAGGKHCRQSPTPRLVLWSGCAIMRDLLLMRARC